MTRDDYITDVKTRFADQRSKDGRLISEIPDDELFDKMMERYPGDAEMIDDVEIETDIPKSDVQERLDEVKKTYGSRLMSTYDRARQKIGESVTRASEKFNAANEEGGPALGGIRENFRKTGALLEGALGTAAAGTQAIFAPVTAGVETVMDNTGISDAISESETVQTIAEPIRQFSEENPDLSRNIGDVLEVVTAGTASKVAKPVLDASARQVVKGAVDVAGKTATKAGVLVDEGIETIKKARLEKQKAAVDEAVGRIIQGEPSDIAKAKRALKDIDVEGVKTYKELNARIDERTDALVKKLDTILDQQKTPLKGSELANRINVDGKTVFQTPVYDAIEELQSYYTKIGDVANAERMRQLKQKLDETGLTLREVNDLARRHGKDLNAFNASGELASGLSKQAAENTRKGLKTVVRDRMESDVAKEIDTQISDLLKTSDLTKKMEVKVNQLYQKVKKRGLLERVARAMGDIANIATFNTVSGFLSKFFPSQVGLKQMNSIDIEAELAKNLKKIDNMLDEGASDEAIVKEITDVMSGQTATE